MSLLLSLAKTLFVRRTNAVEGHVQAARAELEAGRHEKSRALFKQVLKSAPRRSDSQRQARLGYGLSLLAVGNWREAKREFETAFAGKRPNVEAGIRLGELFFADKQIDAAINTYHAVLKFNPLEPLAHYGLGTCFLRKGRIEEAKSAFDRTLEIYPDHGEAMTARALISFFHTNPKARTSVSSRPLVCVLLSPFTSHWLGGQLYVLNFAKAIQALSLQTRPRLVVAVVVPAWERIETLKDTVGKLAQIEAVIGVFGPSRELLLSSPILNRYRRRVAPDSDWVGTLFSSVSNTFPVVYPTSALGELGKPIYWIPDFQHKLLPENFGADETRHRNVNMLTLAQSTCPIVFSSKDASSHFDQFFEGYKARPYIWHFCSSLDVGIELLDLEEYTALKLPDRFYYIANQFWPHKGYDTVFRALRVLLDRGIAITIACSGSAIEQSRDPYHQSMLALVETLGLREQIRFLGVLPRGLQMQVMRRACAIVQPSLFEGWSTVVEDARALGRPLILSDIGVHREQIGDAGFFFPAGDAQRLADRVEELDPQMRPGPDLLAEAAAHRKLLSRFEQSGRNFVAILNSERERDGQRTKIEATAARKGRAIIRSVISRFTSS